MLTKPHQELELRLETQKQTLNARDESIKKLLEMLQNKGMGKWNAFFFHNVQSHTERWITVYIGKEEERQMFQQMQAMAQKQVFATSMFFFV